MIIKKIILSTGLIVTPLIPFSVIACGKNTKSPDWNLNKTFISKALKILSDANEGDTIVFNGKFIKLDSLTLDKNNLSKIRESKTIGELVKSILSLSNDDDKDILKEFDSMPNRSFSVLLPKIKTKAWVLNHDDIKDYRKTVDVDIPNNIKAGDAIWFNSEWHPAAYISSKSIIRGWNLYIVTAADVKKIKNSPNTTEMLIMDFYIAASKNTL